MATETPKITIHNIQTGEIIEREMTEQEYAQLLADGWTPGEEATEE